MVPGMREDAQDSGVIPAMGMSRRGNPHVAGNPVGGSDAFVGREDVLRAVVQALAEPKNQGLVLYGQRRIGKTSILQHLEKTLTERTGHIPVYFDLQDNAAKSLATVLVELAADIAAGLKLPGPTPGPEVEPWFRDVWLPSVLDGLPAGVSLVLLFDEFDVLTEDQVKDVNQTTQATSAFFPYLRRLLDKSAPRLRVVFVIGRNIDDMENVAHALFKGMSSWQVSLLSRDDAEKLIRLAERNGSLKWSDEAVGNAWDLTHGHPLFLQALCSHVWVRANDRNIEDPVTVQEVEVAADLVVSTTRNAFEWLWKGLPPGKRVVAAALAMAGPEAISEEKLHEILINNGARVIIRELRDAPKKLMEWDLLEEPAPKQYQFRVELLRRLIDRYKLDRVQEDLDQIEPTADLLYRTAEAMFRTGDLESAVVQLRAAIRLNPSHVRASELLADLLISRQDWEGARKILEPLYETWPAVARPRLVQVLLAVADGAPVEDARLSLYDAVIRVDTKNFAAAEGIRRVKEALAKKGAEQVRKLEQEGAYAQARELVEQLVQTYGDIFDFQAEVKRVTESLELDDIYKRATLGSEPPSTTMALLASIIGRRHDFKDAIHRLYKLTTGIDVALLDRSYKTAQQARLRAESRVRELEVEIKATNQHLARAETKRADVAPRSKDILERKPPPKWKRAMGARMFCDVFFVILVGIDGGLKSAGWLYTTLFLWVLSILILVGPIIRINRLVYGSTTAMVALTILSQIPFVNVIVYMILHERSESVALPPDIYRYLNPR